MQTQRDYEADVSAFPPQAAPPHKFIAHITRPINDGAAQVVRILRGHDEPDAQHTARELFPDATRIRVQRLDVARKLRRLTYAEAKAVLLFGVAERKGVEVDALTFGVDYDNIALDEGAFAITQGRSASL